MPKQASPRQKKKPQQDLKKALVTTQCKEKIIYLDNNATTLICTDAANEFKRWISCLNPASDSRAALPVRQLIEKAKTYIEKHCSLKPNKYTIIFTSGATESNCFVLRSSAEAYKRLRGVKPHIIISATEHSSILDACLDMEKCGQIELSMVKPNVYGCILADAVKREIKPNTALISIMYAQNEIGCINNVAEISKIAHANKIPFHSDAVQIFGKCKIDIPAHGIDALSASFHKFYGPKGVGLLILNNDFLEGYQLHAIISGHQQNGLRGGTENPAGIAASIAAMKWNFTQRKQKNQHLLNLRNLIINELGTHFKWGNYLNYVNPKTASEPLNDIELVLLGPPTSETKFYLPNTLLISICDNKNDAFCNVKFKKKLDKKNVVVSIGSACLTDSDKASHVLTAIGAPPIIKKGTVRISLGDSNTPEEVKKFCQIFIQACRQNLS